eukprot:4026924-Amphidinium_carterae.1
MEGQGFASTLVLGSIGKITHCNYYLLFLAWTGRFIKGHNLSHGHALWKATRPNVLDTTACDNKACIVATGSHAHLSTSGPCASKEDGKSKSVLLPPRESKEQCYD